MVTAESTESNVLAALSAECDGFLVKPVRRSVLIAKLVSLELLTENVARGAAGARPDHDSPAIVADTRQPPIDDRETESGVQAGAASH